jgi:hypothetical protein
MMITKGCMDHAAMTLSVDRPAPRAPRISMACFKVPLQFVWVPAWVRRLLLEFRHMSKWLIK